MGQKARIFAIAYPELPVDGIVDSIGVSAKVAQGQQGQSFAVKIRLLDPEKITLRPGMTCPRRDFHGYTDRRHRNPDPGHSGGRGSFCSGKSERHVFVMRGSRAARVTVQVGLSDDTYQEVKTGVAETDEVITGPDRVLRALKDGDRVIVRKKTETK